MNLKSICGIAALALAFSFARADDPLRFYASFDSGFVPEIALDGTKVIKIPEPAPLKSKANSAARSPSAKTRASATSGIRSAQLCPTAAGL